MIGIYMLINDINKKKYIGQSKRLMERLGEHYRSAQPEIYRYKSERDSNSSIHLAMKKYGITNFSFKIIEICNENELDDRERYWIKYYDTYKSGYNETLGGQKSFSNKGENHSQAKLTKKDVNNIKTYLRNNKKLAEILDVYPNISKSTLSMINHGKIWQEEGEIYPIAKLETGNTGSKNGRAKLKDEEVYKLRIRYSKGESISDIYKDYISLVSRATIESAIYGKTFKNIPIYKKQKQQWIGPCIDYPQSLK